MSKSTSSPLSAAQRQKVYQKTDGRCWYCGANLKIFPPKAWQTPRYINEDMKLAFTVDHLTPRAKGGRDSLSNLVPACQSCNCSKGKKTVEEYREHVSLWVQGIPKFTSEQREWLVQNGYPDPHAEAFPYQFFGEWKGVA